MTDVIAIIGWIAPWVVTAVFAILYFVKTKKFINLSEVYDEVSDIFEQVLAFFDRERAMSETPLEVIQTIIPANTYQMTEEDCNRILDTCASEEERSRIDALITSYENPAVEGEECCIYTIETSGAIFEVRYGNPVLLLDKKAV